MIGASNLQPALRPRPHDSSVARREGLAVGRALRQLMQGSSSSRLVELLPRASRSPPSGRAAISADGTYSCQNAVAQWRLDVQIPGKSLCLRCTTQVFLRF